MNDLPDFNLFGDLSKGTASTYADKEQTSLSMDDIYKAFDLVKDIPRLPFDEVWAHSKVKLPEDFVITRSSGQGDEKFSWKELSGIPVLTMDCVPVKQLWCWKKGNILKGEFPELVFVVNLE